jgi:hypothetical protein
MKKFVALAALAACSLATAADWQPLPGGAQDQYYDAGNVIWEGKGRVQVITREVLTEARAKNTYIGRPLRAGAAVETTLLLSCSERRAYQRFGQYYDEHAVKVAYTDTRKDLPFDNVDKAQFSGKPHAIQQLFNHLCKKGKN